MINHLRFNPDYPSQLIASMNCPIFRRSVDVYIDPQVSVSYAEACVRHWQYQANVLIPALTQFTQLFSEDFCKYVGEDLDSMINNSDYSKITEDVYIDLRELLLRWNIEESLVKEMIRRIKIRVSTHRKYKNIITVKNFFLEEIISSLPKEQQPYHLVRPLISSNVDVLQYIKPLCITIYVPKIVDTPQVYISLDCAWDEEYGLAWLVRNEKILYVGSDRNLDVWLADEVYESLEGNYAFGNILMKYDFVDLSE